MTSVRWVVSSEDSPYMAWQCALLAYSARTRCGVRPTVMIHDPVNAPGGVFNWPPFVDAYLYRAKSYRAPVCGKDYPPRNFPGTLLEAAKRFEEDWLVLMDPDLIFTRDPGFALEWSADRVGYGPETARVGVPYVVERRRGVELATEWLKVLDSAKAWSWELVMWAYVVAMRRLGIAYRETEYAESNFYGAQPSTRSMVHYCYGDNPGSRWSKRKYWKDTIEVFEDIPVGLPATIEGQIFLQLRELREVVYGRA